MSNRGSYCWDVVSDVKHLADFGHFLGTDARHASGPSVPVFLVSVHKTHPLAQLMMNRNDMQTKPAGSDVIPCRSSRPSLSPLVATGMRGNVLVVALIQLVGSLPPAFTARKRLNRRSRIRRCNGCKSFDECARKIDDAKSAGRLVVPEQPTVQPVLAFFAHPIPSRPGESTAKTRLPEEQETRRQSTFLVPQKTPEGASYLPDSVSLLVDPRSVAPESRHDLPVQRDCVPE